MQRLLHLAVISIVLITTMSAIGAGDPFSRPVHAAASDPVTVRSWQHSDFGRLVIEWADPIRVHQKRDGNRLTLRFARPFSADARPAVAKLTAYLDEDQVGADGSDLSLILKPDTTVKLQLFERRIVVLDFRRPVSKEFEVRVDVARINNGVRLTFDWPRPTRFQASQSEQDFDIRFNALATIDQADMTMLGTTLQPWFSAVRQSPDAGGTLLSFDLKPMIVPAVRSDGPRRIVVDLVRDAAATAARPVHGEEVRTADTSVPRPREDDGDRPMPPVPRKRPTLPQVRSADDGKAGEKLVAAPPLLDDVDFLEFAWDEPTGAAIFSRAGHLWVVFDAPPTSARTPVPPSVPPSLASLLGAGEMVTAEGGTAVRFAMKQDLGFDISQEQADRWRIKPRTDMIRPEAIEIVKVGEPATLRASTVGGDRIVSLIDPEVGDQIDVWPLREAGLGQPNRRRFVDLEFLATAQGLAWRALSDQLAARIRDGRLEFDGRNGLLLSDWSTSRDASSPAEQALLQKRSGSIEPPPGDEDRLIAAISPDTARPDGDGRTDQETDHSDDQSRNDGPPSVTSSDTDPPNPSSFFNLTGLNVERTLVSEKRRLLRQAIGKASIADRNRARLDLARLLVAERLAAEARTVLGTISDDASDYIAASRRALRGVSAFLFGEMTEASSLLLASEFDRDDEIRIWRAALQSINQNWNLASKDWRAVQNTLDIYPPKLRFDLGLMAVQAAIETGDDNLIRKGFRRLNSLELSEYDKDRVQWMRALAAQRSGDVTTTETILRRLARSSYAKVRTMTNFQLGTLGLDTASPDLGKLANLDRKQPLWRGHPEEANMLDILARRFRDANQPRKALTIWRRLSDLFPEKKTDRDIRQLRQETFVRAVANEMAQPIGPLESYSIYLDFADLLPDGPERRRLHHILARHLADLDLLDEAIALLETMVDDAATALEKAEIGAEAADLALRRDRGAQTITILDRTQTPGLTLPQDLAEQRLLARARALTLMDRLDQALRQIQDSQNLAARRLRAEILWKMHDWPRLASVVETYLASPDIPEPLSVDDQRLVLWLALARERQGQTQALYQLRDQYADNMQTGPLAEAFLVATQTPGTSSDIQSLLASTASYLSELRNFRESTRITQ